MQGLIFAVVVLGLVVVAIWGLAEAERDRDRRARDRELMREIRRHEVGKP